MPTTSTTSRKTAVSDKTTASGGAPKVKVRKAAAASSTTMSIKDFYKHDDTAASTFDVVANESNYNNLCERLRTALRTARDAKTDAEQQESSSELRLLLLALRRENRLAHFANHQLNDTLVKERNGVDAQYLQLQNVIHEVQHLQKEIQRCLQFKSSDEDIDLVPITKFYQEAPPEISKLGVTKGNEHELRLARLNWELSQRKRLLEELEEKQSKANALNSDINKRSDVLAELKPQVEQILEASRPLQQTLNMKFERNAEQRETTRYLPQPLFNLYVQTRAYIEIMDKQVQISIDGDLDEAKQFSQKQALQSDPITLPRSGTQSSDESGPEDNEESQAAVGETSAAAKASVSTATAPASSGSIPVLVSGSSVQATMGPPVIVPVQQQQQQTLQAPRAGNSRSRSRSNTPQPSKSSKRANKKSSKRSSKREKNSEERTERRTRTVSEVIDLNRHEILNVHPLCVKIAVPVRGVGSISLSFKYMTELEVVLVDTLLHLDDTAMKQAELLNPETLLQDLCGATDAGVECPNPTGRTKLLHFGLTLKEHTKDVGFAYRWAQTLGGLKFPEMPVNESSADVPQMNTNVAVVENNEDVPSEERGCNFMQKIVAALKRRVRTRIALHKHLRALELNKIPALAVDGVHDIECLAAPTKVLSRLTRWKTITAEEYLRYPATRHVCEQFGISTNSTGWFFQANIDRGEVKLTCLIHVGVAYPSDVPLFALALKWGNTTHTAADCPQLRDLECAVNYDVIARLIDTNTTTVECTEHVLAIQVQFVASRLDVLLECESDRIEIHPEFTREHLFARLASGPTRELPLAFDQSANCFQF